MLHELTANPIPDWLSAVTPENIRREPFPLHGVLKDSLYYPSSGFDGRPVQYLGGHIHSFIHVDHGRSREELEEQLTSEDARFHGYEVLATREVEQTELTPNGWTPASPRREDGNPARHRGSMQAPYCLWFVFQRTAGLAEEHGPGRFSLLHLCADGVAAFQALYHSNKMSPKAIAIIAPGSGFGLNWTDFGDPTQILYRSVMKGPSEPPQMLVGDAPYWPEYHSRLATPSRHISIWSRSVAAA